ncbi:MAG: hypothetical protein LC667_01330 [Thioalkalivibrio sp.]|nr:hypothetical protein [Thioalkalivibrio sp.]
MGIAAEKTRESVAVLLFLVGALASWWLGSTFGAVLGVVALLVTAIAVWQYYNEPPKRH